MIYKLTQAELCEAISNYLNGEVLQRPVRITSVRQITLPAQTRGADVALEVECADDQSQVAHTEATLADEPEPEVDAPAQ